MAYNDWIAVFYLKEFEFVQKILTVEILQCQEMGGGTQNIFCLQYRIQLHLECIIQLNILPTLLHCSVYN